MAERKESKRKSRFFGENTSYGVPTSKYAVLVTGEERMLWGSLKQICSTCNWGRENVTEALQIPMEDPTVIAV
jgi:hypothetical protein